jgi:hypothetical protein
MARLFPEIVRTTTAKFLSEKFLEVYGRNAPEMSVSSSC